MCGDQTKPERRNGAGKIRHDVGWERGPQSSVMSIKNKMITENPETFTFSSQVSLLFTNQSS